jgi:Skp family chaperone for outer membrane proteins
VMREYKRAKTGVERLNAKRVRMSANVVGMRNMYTELQAMAKTATDPKRKEEIAGDIIMLARRIEDTDREINKILNDRASMIIAELYDEIHAAVGAMAREHNLAAVLAYPDAVTKEEAESPYVKELKLKPPAAQPFYVDPSAEFSNELIRRLNEKFDENNN